MEIDLKEKERIDDLELQGLKIIQSKDGFCFGMDSVLLSDFAKEIKPRKTILDMGTGTGILGILLCAKTQETKIVGVEIQEEVADMTQRSVKLNDLEDRFTIICQDIKNLSKIYEAGSFDAIVTNPPYKKRGTGGINENEKKLISRHEITADLENFIEIASYLLKDQGSIYIVHRPERLFDIFNCLHKYKIEPKNLKFVYPNYNKEPNLILIKATKNAKPFLKVEKPIYVYKEDGNYTEEILKIYNKI